ncbi:MAG: Fic family protein, partial [Pyrinomonadaceae bacterium]
MNALEKAEQLKNELDNLRPLDVEAEARIMQKFRLDWNYHSNNLEGNSLTYGETKALILFGITAQGKPLKDHFEITGHNEAINWILEIVKGETVLTESFIRQLHTLLLKETSYKEAKTPEGQTTRRKIEVGRYKTQPNHVITVTGETFYFATPEETPAKMHELIEWFRKEKEKADTNPIILAAIFHYRFIRIHPFDDGNGRVARILMNFILMQFGYPPAIIKTEDKENYYAVLRLADAGELEPFIEYITENLIRSLEIMIRGAKGENIEEPDDLDKELALLERKFITSGDKLEVDRNFESIANVFKLSIEPLLEKVKETCEKFDKFYVTSKMILDIDGRKSEFIKNQSFYGINDDIWFYKHIENINFEYQHQSLRKSSLSGWWFVIQTEITFSLKNYYIT